MKKIKREKKKKRKRNKKEKKEEEKKNTSHCYQESRRRKWTKNEGRGSEKEGGGRSNSIKTVTSTNNVGLHSPLSLTNNKPSNCFTWVFHFYNCHGLKSSKFYFLRCDSKRWILTIEVWFNLWFFVSWETCYLQRCFSWSKMSRYTLIRQTNKFKQNIQHSM